KYLLSCLLILPMYLLCVNEPEEKTDGCTLSNPENGIEIVSPKEGDTFIYGDTVKLNFKVNTDLVQGIRVQGKNGANIFGSSISFEPEPQFQCADTNWIIGEESVQVNYAENDTITLILSDYNSPYICDSVKIVVQKPVIILLSSTLISTEFPRIRFPLEDFFTTDSLTDSTENQQ
ncbi:MAG: hypothetical protein Q4F84_04130, partial [Fibrobacter sp.]|nr:hypothetical protein [Fibrobacter sp.]